MAKISELEDVAAPDGSEAVPILKAGVAKKTTLGSLVSAVATPFVTLAQKWAEGTLPGGAGTKSAKEWATDAAASANTLGTVTSSGTNPPVAGTGGASGSLVDATPFGGSGTLQAWLYATADGWAWPFTCSLNGDGTIKLEQLGVPNRMTAGQVTAFTLFTPDVTATQYFGVMTDQACIGVNNAATGKTTWNLTGGVIPGTASSGSTGKAAINNYRMQLYWEVNTGARSTSLKNTAARLRSEFALGTAYVTAGTFPAVDGTTSFQGAYQIFIREPAAQDGWISPSVFLAGAGSGYFVVCSRNTDGTFKIEDKEAAPRTFTAGANSPGVIPVRIRRGQFVGIYSAAAVRYTAGGIGSYFKSGEPGAVGSSQTLTFSSGTAQLSFQVVPSLDGEVARAKAAEQAIAQGFSGATITQGVYPAADGTGSVASGNLALFPELPISSDGALQSSALYSAIATTGQLVLASKNGSNQFTLVELGEAVNIAVGANTFSLSSFKTKSLAGLYLGIYTVGAALRYTGTGGPGVRYTNGLPGTNTASTLLSNWLLAFGWTIQTGVNPRVTSLESRVTANEAALAGSAARQFRPFDSLGYVPPKGNLAVIAWNGQSNSASTYQGATVSTPLSTSQLFANKMYDTGALVPLVSVTTEKSHVTAANFATAKRVKDAGTAGSAEPLAAFTAGVPGASITQIQSGSAGFTSFTNQVSQLFALEAGLKVPVMNFVQGETDNQSNMTQAAWKASMVTLRNDLETAVRGIIGGTDTLHVIFMQPSAQLTAGGAGPVLAQLELAQTDTKYFLCGAPMYRFQHSTVDNIHLPNVGFKLQGAYFGKANAALLAGKKPQWINPLSATYDGSVITVKLDVPVKPLLFDPVALGATVNQGFKVTDNGVAATINSLAIVDDKVVITCAAPLTGPVVVRYALDYLGAGRNIANGASGTLRDSDPETITISGTSYQLFNCAPHFQLTATNVGV